MSTDRLPGPDPLVGRALDGRYRLDEVIARGGMATVYLATDTRLDRPVAVKVLRQALADDPAVAERFTREARAAARLTTPDIVAVHDQGEDGGTAYLVMEHVPGTTLRGLLRDRGALPPAEALDLVEPVLRALAAAHAAGIVHRDVKPENVLLGTDGRVRVADFGLARAAAASGLTGTVAGTTGVVLGTVAYLAPEVVERGAGDPRSDVYAVGVLLWELLTGTPPYDGDNPLTIAYRHVNEDVPPPSTVAGPLPVALDDLVTTATRRDPASRFADAGAMLAQLRAVRPDVPDAPAGDPGADPGTLPTVALALPRRGAAGPAGRTGASTGPAADATRRPRVTRRRLLVALVAVLAVAAASGGWWLGSGRYTQAPDVGRLTFAAASAALTERGLSVRREADVFSETVPAGQVAEQDPGPGERVRRDGTVRLTVSKGADRRAVPAQVTGATVEEATALLTRAGLTVGPQTQAFSGSVPVGRVVTTDPAPGTRLRPGTAVGLVVSRGPELLDVPDVRGRTEAQARETLTGAGFVVAVTTVFSDSVAAGKVIGQSPFKGTAQRGSTVTLTVSKGPDLVTVPRVVGLTEKEAKQVLTAAGLKVRVSRIPGPGVVRSCDPDEGTRVRRGSTVTVYVF